MFGVLNPLNVDITNHEHVEIIIDEIEGHENLERKKVAWQADQILTGNQSWYVQDALKIKYPISHKNFRIGDISLAKKVIGKKGKAYKNEPIRELKNKRETTAYGDIFKRGQFSRSFKEGDKIFNYWKYVLFWLKWIEALDDDEEEGHYALQALKPFEYDLIRDPRTGEPLIFIMSLPTNDITGSVGTNDQDQQTITENKADISANTERYAIWSKHKHVEVIKRESFVEENGNQVLRRSFDIVSLNEGDENPFAPMLPCAFLSADTGPEYPTPNNLAQQSIDFNVGFSNLLTATDAQGHGQLVNYHPAKQKVSKLHVGMHTAIDVPMPPEGKDRDPKIEYINANPDLDGQLKVLQFQGQQILDEHGIKPKGAITGGTEKFASGFDRLLSEADCMEIIEDNQSLFASTIEQDLFKIIKSGEDTMGKSTFVTNEVMVKFPKPKVLISDKETIDNIRAQDELGLLLPHEKHMILDPNLDEKKARKREEEIQEQKDAQMQKEADFQKTNFGGRNIM